jgi:type I restriction-modification system DNA methylase subunit
MTGIGTKKRLESVMDFACGSGSLLLNVRKKVAQGGGTIGKIDFNLNISRYISTAVGEEEIDLEETHRKLVEIESAIQAARIKHNAFLKELGLPVLPPKDTSTH